MVWLSLKACREAVSDLVKALRDRPPDCTCVLGNPRGTTAIRACPRHGDERLR